MPARAAGYGGEAQPTSGGSRSLDGRFGERAILVFMVLLVNDARLMGKHRNGRLANVVAWGAIGLLIMLDAVLLGVTALGFVEIEVG